LNSDNSKASLRVNLNNEITSWYTLKAQLSLVRQKSNRAITTTGGWPDGAGLMDLLKSPPTADLNYLGTNAAAVPGGESPGGHFNNPYIELLTKTDVSKNDYAVYNLENVFRIANGLQLVASVGSVQSLTRRQIYLPITGNGGFFQNGKGNNSMANTYSYNVNGYFLYDKVINTDHRLNAILGIEYNTQTLEMLGATTSNYNRESRL
jgi:hypothetical protein